MNKHLVHFLKKSRTGKLWPVVSVGYSVLVHVSLFMEAFMDKFRAKPCTDTELENVTAVVKTFERPERLRQLVKSILKLYPTLKIIVVDDSKTPSQLPGVKTITLPFDSGVSAGRNAGLAAIETDYMLCLDDDFIFNRHTDILKAFKNIEQNPNIDILAGEVVYLPLRIVHDYSKLPLLPISASQRARAQHKSGSFLGGFPVLEKVPNFYIARTNRIRLIGWDENLKRLDHADFFTRAIGVLTVVQDRSFKVLHHPTYFNQKYMVLKNDTHADQITLHNKYYHNTTPNTH